MAGVIVNESPAMSVQDAGNLLRKAGINTKNLDDDTVKRVMSGLPEDQAGEIAKAYRLFRAPQEKPAAGLNGKPVNNWSPHADERNDGRPAWAQGLYDYRIKKQDLTDPNFARQVIWKSSGEPSTNPVTLWSFDGQKFTKHLVVFGRSETHKLMAKAMVALAGATKTDAVFMSGRNGKMVLIYLKGRILDQPILLKHVVSGGNPANDWEFVNQLPRLLISLNKKFEKDADPVSGAYKAWINVDKDFKGTKVVDFDTSKTFYDIISERPDLFKVGVGQNMLKVRIAAERKGWCAVGVNVANDQVGAMVNAMNTDMAYRAALILFRLRWKDAEWTSLTIKTNDKTTKFDGRQEIGAYLKAGLTDQAGPPKTQYI
jgi:hypothetical protein